jgi:hypothetical protein
MAYNYGGRKLYVLEVSLKQNKTKDLGERMTCSAKPWWLVLVVFLKKTKKS